jgi:predicted AAA+ superfamily ATPase
MLLNRPSLRNAVQTALRRSRAVVLLGPRQVGETTLARSFVPAGHSHYFDLEDPAVEASFVAPMTLLSGLQGLVVIRRIVGRLRLGAGLAAGGAG